MAHESLLHRRYQTLGTHSPLFYEHPLELVSGSGSWVTSADGTTYLDAYNNVPHVGHAHPEVVRAVTEQMSKLALNTRYLNSRVVDYAEALIATHHESLNRVVFGNSGSEANEVALRMARFASGNTGLLVSDHSYHGTTIELAAATTALAHSEPFAQNARAIRIPDARGLNADETQQQLERSLAEIDEAIASLQEAGFGVAAVIIDGIFSTEGLVTPPQGYVEGLVARVHAAGGLYIADEVQAGFGRLGRYMWGYEQYDTVPDIVTMGKPMGNGHPLSGAMVNAELLEAFGAANMFFNTFAGNPVSSAAGNAVLNVMAEEGLLERANSVGNYLRAELDRQLGDNPRFDGIRGDGLFAGMKFVNPETGDADPATAKRVVEAMVREGVLISRIGRHDEVLKIRPPLAFDREHADLMLEKLPGVIRAL